MLPLRQVWPDELIDRYRHKGYWRGETMSGFLAEKANLHRDRPAVVGSHDGVQIRWTYAELLARTQAIAASVHALGFRPGERIVVQLPNVPSFLSVVFGLFRAGIVPVFALPAHREAEIVHFVRKSEAAGYLTIDRFAKFDYRELARNVAAATELRRILILGDSQEFVSLDDTPGPPHPAHTASPSDVAFLQISGGSTGLSKLIPRTHDDYIYSFRASAEICGLTPESVYLCALPAAHNFPMSSPGTFGALYAGSLVVMAPSPAPETAFRLIEEERVTITGLVPPLALNWMRAARSSDRDLSSLQIVQVGGAKLIPEVARRLGPTLGCRLQQVFGMAEGLVNYTRLDDPEELVVTTQGRPISADDEIRIVDESGEPVPEGSAGHLLTRGPYTIRSYHNEPEANRISFTADGFYRTGDVVRQTSDGYLIVEGRAVDHINRAGEKVSAEEIEDHLLAHPHVFDAAVVSLPDPYLGERSCAFVIPEGEPPRMIELKTFVRQRGLADFKVPDQIVLLDDFHTTAVGKVSRAELRRRLRDQYLQTSQEGS
ncbi:AMP-binding protein [Afifella sp. H1R]|uniref:(2,3-dihydroxybenzoyl)adenylate synthase n=1 Tax=Afifella sp. H1R TaxID=2908841 RepID=UPI001F41A863|nr:AMP-binding protein [Afifella sp. H1R]MCF1502447.1 AMP-binding protein [Afifella sp. H1R]